MKEQERSHTHIPKHIYDKYISKNVSADFLDCANEYFKLTDSIYSLSSELRKKEIEQKKLREKMCSKCNHDYEVQPREMYCSREWICKICGDHI